MVSSWLLLALTIPVPFLFVLGFVAGKRHVWYLARYGGEESYPDRIRRVVEKYRRERLAGVTDD